MRETNATPNMDPTVFGAVWRYRWLVLLVVVIFGAIGAWLAQRQPEEWVATANLVVEDPKLSGIFEQGVAQRPGRYVENQAEIIRSRAVAQKAVESDRNQTLDQPLEVADVLGGLSVVTDNDSDVLTISFKAGTLDRALAAVNGAVEGYQDQLATEGARGFSAAIAEIESSIALRQAELTTVEADIDTALSQDPNRVQLDQQYDEGLERLARLQRQVRGFTGDSLEAVRGELDDVLQDFQTLQVIESIERQRPEMRRLLEQQSEVIARLSELAALRDQVQVDAQLTGSGVLPFSPAEEGRLVGAGMARSTAVLGALGALLATGAAYGFALRRRTFLDRNQPEFILGAPLVAEVPTFRQEGVRSSLPVRAAPRSASAESFRFAASGLYSKRVDGEGPGLAAGSSIVVTSAKIGEGKTVIAANTALALAREGKRVLLIDADFGNQMATELLVPNVRPTGGLTEVVEEGAPLADLVTLVEGSSDSSGLHLLARGWRRSSAPEFFRLPATRAFMQSVAETYDLVIVDAPPLLQVAYASTIVGLVDSVLLVVPHRGSVADLEEVEDRLRLLGTPALGYVYNLAPLRIDMTVTEGSMKDVLGGHHVSKGL